MNLKNYFFITLFIFLLGLFHLYTGINHPSKEKIPVIHQDQGHSMHPNNDVK